MSALMEQRGRVAALILERGRVTALVDRGVPRDVAQLLVVELGAWIVTDDPTANYWRYRAEQP